MPSGHPLARTLALCVSLSACSASPRADGAHPLSAAAGGNSPGQPQGSGGVPTAKASGGSGGSSASNATGGNASVGGNTSSGSSGGNASFAGGSSSGGAPGQGGSGGSGASLSGGAPGQGGSGGGIQVSVNPDDFKVPHFSAVTTTSDVPFATVMSTTYVSGGTLTARKATSLFLDIYEPEGDTSAYRPVILWMHGGGFRTDSVKTQGYIVSYATEFAKRGYVSISIDYRLRFKTGDGHVQADEFPALQDAARDANTALDWVRTHASEYRINPNWIFAAGGSAGGRTTVTFSCFDGPDTTAAYAPENAYVATPWNKTGLIATATLWGGLEPEMRGWVYRTPNGGEPNATINIPTTLIHGTADTTIAYQNSVDLYNELVAAGATAELHPIAGAEHTPTGSTNDPIIWGWMSDFFTAEWKKKLGQ